MISISYPSKNSQPVKVTCSDGKVFTAERVEDCYDEAMAHEREYINSILANYATIEYDILADKDENPNGYDTLVAFVRERLLRRGNRKLLYTLRPKPGLPHEKVAYAMEVWYDQLVIELHANEMWQILPDTAVSEYRKCHPMLTLDLPLRDQDAFAVIAEAPWDQTIIWLSFTTINKEVWDCHRRIEKLPKKQAFFQYLGERVVDIGIK